MKLGIEEEEDIIIMSCSQAATNTIERLAMEDDGLASSSSCSSSTISLGGRAIDRCNPIIRDATRLGKVVQLNTTSTKPPSSPHQPTTDPKHLNGNFIKSMINIHQTKKKKKTSMISSLKKEKQAPSRADCADKMVNKTSSTSKPATDDYEIIVNSPGDSSRYLLTTTNSSSTHDLKSFIYSHRFDPRLAMVDQSSRTSPFSSSQLTCSPASAASNHQVVVLGVSLHCRGCERKMRKHISKMEGVTSFNIDFATKKLTVAGDVTPLSVLASVSKVKKARLLTSPPPITSSSTIPSCSNNTISPICKDKGILV